MFSRKTRRPAEGGAAGSIYRRLKSLLWSLKSPFRKFRKKDYPSENPSSRLKVYLFNVGQGDHILFELPNGEYGIVDFYFEGSLGLKEPPALTYLKNLRLRSPEKPIVISFVCISHPDTDHIKGADTFLRWAAENHIKIGNLWLPAGKNFSRLYDLYAAAVRRYATDDRMRDRALEIKDRLRGVRDYMSSKAWTGHTDSLQGAIRPLDADLAGGMQVILVAPLNKHIDKFDEKVWEDFLRSVIENRAHTTAPANLVSSVLLMIFNQHRLLLGGDTGLNVWLECLDEYDRTHQERYFGPCRANFIKVSHHGSRHSSSPALWERITGKRTLFAISAGRGYRHPHAQTLGDIHAAARQTGGTADIFSTNTCTTCLGNQRTGRESLENLTYQPPGYKPEAAQTLKMSQPPSFRAGKKLSPALGAYVFRFNVSDDTIISSQALSEHAPHRPCVYGNNPGRTFPGCAAAPPAPPAAGGAAGPAAV